MNQTISTIVGQQYTFSILETQDFSTSIVGFVFANGVPLTLSGTPGFWADNSGRDATYGQITGVFTATSNSTTISIGSIVFAWVDSRERKALAPSRDKAIKFTRQYIVEGK